MTQIAGLLQRQVRESDVACRYGGEEFVMILSGASLEGARQKAERIRGAIKALELKHGGLPLGTITASLGIALFPAHAMDAESLLHAADLALYEAKSDGRDRVVVCRPGQSMAGDRGSPVGVAAGGAHTADP